MADITPATPPEINLVRAYGNGGFRIGGVAHTGSVVVLPTEVAPWPVGDVADITEESLKIVTELGAARRAASGRLRRAYRASAR